MKKRLCSLWAFTLALALAGCGKAALTSPPALSVECGSASMEAWQGTYSWMYGTSSGVESDSRHPLDCKDSLPVLEAEEDTAVLNFAEAPDNISVRCWSDAHWSDPSAESEDIVVEGNEIKLKHGGYIYEITAQWNSQKSYGGTANYAFYAVTADE